MATVTLQGAKNLNELAQRVYALKAGDPRIAKAAKALADANPKLTGDLSKMAPATPVTVPPMAQPAPTTQPSSTTSGAPPEATRAADLVKMITLLPDTVKQMMATATQPQSAAQDPTRAAMLQRFTQAQTALNVKPAPPPKQAKKQADTGLQSFNSDVTAFLKTHGS